MQCSSLLASTLDDYSRLLFSPVFPLSFLPSCRNQMLGPDATVDDDSYYTGGAYYYVQATDDNQE